MGDPGLAQPQGTRLAGYPTARGGRQSSAWAPQALGWAPPGDFLAAYPGNTCRNLVLEEDLDRRALAYRDMDPDQPFTDAEASGFSENLDKPEVVEEYQRSVEALVEDLADYLCQVHKAWAYSDAPDRDQMLYDRLVAAKGPRQSLGVGLRNAQKTVQSCWNRLAREPQRWKEPADDVTILEWPFGMPDPLRVEVLQDAARRLEQAKKSFDAHVLPLVQALKQELKRPRARDAEERIEAPADPGPKRKRKK